MEVHADEEWSRCDGNGRPSVSLFLRSSNTVLRISVAPCTITRPMDSLSYALATECGGGIICGRAFDTELVGFVFVVETDSEVTAIGKIGVDLERAPERGDLVIIDAMRFRNAPDLTTRIVLVDDENLPAVFVDVERAAGIDVFRAGLECGIDNPDAVQFIAGKILVDMKWFENVGDFHMVAAETIGIIRHDHFLFAD